MENQWRGVQDAGSFSMSQFLGLTPGLALGSRFLLFQTLGERSDGSSYWVPAT